MRASQRICPLRDPSAESVRYVLEVEVKGGVVRRTAPLREDPEGVVPPLSESWFTTLNRYCECLVPRLRAMEMAPAPADGTYLLGYATPGSGGQ